MHSIQFSDDDLDALSDVINAAIREIENQLDRGGKHMIKEPMRSELTRETAKLRSILRKFPVPEYVGR